MPEQILRGGRQCRHLAPRDEPCTLHVVLPKPTAKFKSALMKLCRRPARIFLRNRLAASYFEDHPARLSQLKIATTKDTKHTKESH